MNRFLHKPGSYQNSPRIIIEHKGYWYMDSKGSNEGCCWWTGLGVLTYDDNLLLQGLTQLTPVKGEKWRSHPFNTDKFTRDHLISALTALSVKDLVTAKQAIAKTKLYFGADWFWLKAIQNEDNWKGKIYAKLFALFISPVLGIPAVDLQLYTMRRLDLGRFPLLSNLVRKRRGNVPLVSLYTGKKIDKSIIKNYTSTNAVDKDLLWKLYNEL